ncbi:MAG: RraA family protein [Candidatus Limnocylindrales bacterium]
MMPSASDLERLRTFGSATVYEVAGGVTPLDPAIRALASTYRVAGPAFTVHCARGDNLALHRAVAEAAPGSVLVVDAGGDAAGYWGEILSVAALARGIAGLVIDGGVRDTVPIVQRGFPVWSRHVAIGRCLKVDPGELGGAVVAGGVTIAAGDIVVADADGIVVIPAPTVAGVVVAAEQRTTREAELFERLRAGELTIDLLGLRDRLP